MSIIQFDQPPADESTKDEAEEDIPLSSRLVKEAPNIRSKFWKDNSEDTITASSSDERKGSLQGPRKKTGAPRKKKRKEKGKRSDKKEGKETGEDKPRGNHKALTRTKKTEGKKLEIPRSRS